jgi:transposase
MGKSYSADLRKMVLSSLDGGMSKMEAHRLYRVSRTTLDDWLLLRQQTGDVAPLPRRAPVKERVLSGEVFAEFARRHAGQKLGQMAQAWEQEQGQSLSEMSFSRALRRVGNVAPKGWTRKKRVGVTKSVVKTSAPSS